jgi:transglutaminase-like putative cysteine protease
MTLSPRPLQLQAAGLALLWLSLLSVSKAQPLVLVSLPALIALRLWSPQPLRQRRRLWTNAIGLPLIGACLAMIPLADRSAWLAGFSNLLWLLSGLKLLEVEQPGAVRRSGLLLLLAVGCAGVFAPDLGPSLLQGGAALLAVGSLLALELGGSSQAGLIRRLLLLVGVSLPLMVALFVLAPRLGPIWLLQGGGNSTGLSDQLDPGSIASLARSDAPAMRLQFEGIGPPSPAQRYWRILTLNQFDGRRWSAAPGEPALTPPTPAEAATEQPQLVVLLEPTNLRWLAWQGRGQPLPATIRRSADGGLWQNEPVRSHSLYRLAGAGPQAPQPWREVAPTTQDLEVPAASNPRLQTLGRQWGALAAPAARVEAARQWFLAQGFRYTLEPGPLPSENGLDTFLFSTRQGFCEHFASAFTALMRSAGVPARVVIGYQGGEWVKPIGGGNGHLQVRQSDAHAWSEVWLPGQGWTRVDPTAWVVPSRPEQNLYDSLGSAGSSNDQRLLRESPSWLQWLGGQWQALDLNWSLWVMQFDQTRQEALLRQLFGSNASRWQGAVLIASVGLLLAGTLVLLHWLRPQEQDRLRRELERCLQRLGIDLPPGAPLEAALEAAGPGVRQQLEPLLIAYQQQRFAPAGQPGQRRRQQAALIRSLRRLRDLDRPRFILSLGRARTSP